MTTIDKYDFYEDFICNLKYSKKHNIKKNDKFVLQQQRKINKFKQTRFKQNNILNKLFYANEYTSFYNIVNEDEYLYVTSNNNISIEEVKTELDTIPINTNGNHPYKLTKEELEYCRPHVMCICCDADIVAKMLDREYYGCKYGSGCHCCYGGFDLL